MPETAAKTTNPRRRRTTPAATTTTTAATKPRTTTKAAAKKQPTEAEFTFDLAYIDDTKNYSRFDQSMTVDGNATGFAPNSKLYTPLGTTRVVVTISGPASVIEDAIEEAASE